MAADFIIDVNEADFDYQVLAYSHQIPVVVDFWAEWCVPCRTLSPLLERVTIEAKGGFRLAKLNVDLNQNLAIRYNVRSIPAVKAFRNGTIVSEFTGVQPEPRLREFIRQVAPHPADLILEKGTSLLESGQWIPAREAFQKVLAELPQSPTALLGLVKCLLAQGHPVEAKNILIKIPPSREYSAGEILKPLIDALLRIPNGERILDDPLQAAYQRALTLITRGNIEASLDGLLDILRQDKRYRDGEVRQVILSLFELLGEKNPLTSQYRQEMATILF